jgi:hypothetical protein
MSDGIIPVNAAVELSLCPQEMISHKVHRVHQVGIIIFIFEAKAKEEESNMEHETSNLKLVSFLVSLSHSLTLSHLKSYPDNP